MSVNMIKTGENYLLLLQKREGHVSNYQTFKQWLGFKILNFKWCFIAAVLFVCTYMSTEQKCKEMAEKNAN